MATRVIPGATSTCGNRPRATMAHVVLAGQTGWQGIARNLALAASAYHRQAYAHSL